MQTKQNAINMRFIICAKQHISWIYVPFAASLERKSPDVLHNQTFPNSTHLENWGERWKQEQVLAECNCALRKRKYFDIWNLIWEKNNMSMVNKSEIDKWDCVRACVLSCVPLLATLLTVALHFRLSLTTDRQWIRQHIWSFKIITACKFQITPHIIS